MAITVTDSRPVERADEIPTPEAPALVDERHRRFGGARNDLVIDGDPTLTGHASYELVG